MNAKEALKFMIETGKSVTYDLEALKSSYAYELEKLDNNTYRLWGNRSSQTITIGARFKLSEKSGALYTVLSINDKFKSHCEGIPLAIYKEYKQELTFDYLKEKMNNINNDIVLTINAQKLWPLGFTHNGDKIVLQYCNSGELVSLWEPNISKAQVTITQREN